MLCFQGMSDLKCGLSEESVQNFETPCCELTLLDGNGSGWEAESTSFKSSKGISFHSGPRRAHCFSSSLGQVTPTLGH